MRSLAAEQLIRDSNGETFVVYGDAGAANIRLIDIRQPIDHNALAHDVANGLRFAGTLGLVDGRPKAVFHPDGGSREVEVMRHAALALCHQLFGDSIEWLERLWSLPDARTEAHGA